MAQLNRTHRWRSARPGLSGRARAGAASLFAAVVLLMLAGCGGSGSAGEQSGRPDRVVGSRVIRHGETLG